MYIYFDKNGTIKEVVNDKSIRQGSNEANKFYCYIEGNPSIDDIWYLQKNVDGSLTNEISFKNSTITKAIPYDAKRDMRYFKDFETYTFYVFTLTTNYLKQSGLVSGTIRIEVDNEIFALGELKFNVQENVINTSNGITQSQYDYLLLAYASRTLNEQTGSDLDHLLDEKIDAKLGDIADGSPRVFDTTAHIQALTSDMGLAVATDTGYIWVWNDTDGEYKSTNYIYLANVSAYYTKTEVDSALSLKADKTTTYTKTEADNTFAPKSNAITHTGSQLQDYSGNNVYPTLDDGQVTPNKTIFFKSTKNKFNLYKIVNGYGINSVGVPYENSDWSYINEYIDVGVETKVAISVYQNATCTIVLYCYASDKTYLGYVGYAVTNTVVNTLPNNTKYIIVAYKNIQLDVTTIPVQVELGDTVTSYVLPFVFMSGFIDDFSISFEKLGSTLQNSFSGVYSNLTPTWVNGSYCARNTGLITTDTNQAYTSISVTKGEYYNISGMALANITPYVLKNNLGVIISTGAYYSAWTNYNLIIYIETDGTLYVNSGKYATEGYAKVSKVTAYKPNFLPTVKLTDMSSELQNSFSKVLTEYSVTWINGYYCQRTNGAITADANQAYTSILVTAGEVYHAKGYALANIAPYVLKDTNGTIVDKGDYYNAWTEYDVDINITTNGTLYINSGKYATYGYADIEKFTAYQGVYSSEQTVFENSVLKKRVIDEQLKNDFAWNTNHIPCATFTFDDANSDIDLIASMFEEHNVPVCLAIIPSKLNNVCNGLSANKGSYTVGMTVKQVCQKVVELGGEILVHYGSYLTSSSTDQDYYNVYIKAKKDLEDNGFQTNGIITAGGTNYQTQDFAKDTLIARIYYQYADLTASHNTSIEQFYNRRNFLDSGVASIKTLVDNFVAQTGTQPYSRWLNFASHGTNTTSIEDLEEMLEYVISNNITVTTWKNVYDTYKSSKLEERIKALE